MHKQRHAGGHAPDAGKASVKHPTNRQRRSASLLVRGLGAGGIYGLAIGTLMVGEVALTRTASPTVFGEYQYVRQLIPIIVAATFLGVDQALTRELAMGKSTEYLRPVMKQSTLGAATIGTIAAVASAAIYSLTWAGVVAILLCPVFLVGSELSAAMLRARQKYAVAAFSQQGYRLLGGAAILAAALLGSQGDVSPIILTAGAFTISIWATRSTLKNLPKSGEIDRAEIKRLRILGLGFGISMISMSAIDWLDQAMVAYKFGSLADSGMYAAAKLVTVYPFVSLASILGFAALPEVVKRRNSLTLPKWRMAAATTLVGAMFVWVTSSMVLTKLAPIIIGQEIAAGSIWILSAVGVLRIGYLVPSSVVGAVGTARHLGISGLLGLTAAAVEVTAILYVDLNDPVSVGAIGLLAATLIRILIAVATADIAVKHWNSPLKSTSQ